MKLKLILTGLIFYGHSWLLCGQSQLSLGISHSYISTKNTSKLVSNQGFQVDLEAPLKTKFLNIKLGYTTNFPIGLEVSGGHFEHGSLVSGKRYSDDLSFSRIDSVHLKFRYNYLGISVFYPVKVFHRFEIRPSLGVGSYFRKKTADNLFFVQKSRALQWYTKILFSFQILKDFSFEGGFLSIKSMGDLLDQRNFIQTESYKPWSWGWMFGVSYNISLKSLS